MIDFNVGIVNSQQLAIEKQTNQEPIVKENSSQAKEESSKMSDATNVNLSQIVLSKLNNVISEEDIINKNLNTARTIYDSLADIRLELANIKKTMLNKDLKEQTIAELEDLDSFSNNLIEKAINVVKDNDKTGLVNINFLKPIFNGLNNLKALNLYDNDYLTKIDDILFNVKQEQKAYFDVSEELYQKLENISNKYNQLVENKPNTEKDSSKIQEQIVKDANNALLNTASNITPEMVMRLLNP